MMVFHCKEEVGSVVSNDEISACNITIIVYAWQ